MTSQRYHREGAPEPKTPADRQDAIFVTVLIRIATWLAQAWYELLKLVLPPRHKVVFFSRQSDEPSLDFRLLAVALAERDPLLEVVTRCRRVRPGFGGAIGYLFEMASQMRHLADASACMVDGYIMPVSVLTHRRDLFVLQMWHSLGAIKRFGHQAVGRPGGRPAHLAHAMRMHQNYDAVLCGGPASASVFAEAFGVDLAAVRPLGLPRVDWMREHVGETFASTSTPALRELAARHPELATSGRPVILYAPTYRTRPNDGFELLAQALEPGDCLLLVKPHFLDAAPAAHAGIIDAGGCDVVDLLPLCDAVITDYSAVAFEAWTLDLPVYFFVFDHDAYATEHGLNLDPLVDLPSMASVRASDVAAWVRGAEYNPEAASHLAEAFVPPADANCTAGIAELVCDRLRS